MFTVDVKQQHNTTNNILHVHNLKSSVTFSILAEVYVSFYLLAINELDEVEETLKTTGFLVVEWTDQFLSWNADDYGGIEYYFFPQDDVWKPDIALKNSVEKYKPLGVSTLNVQVSSQGSVYWYPFEVSFNPYNLTSIAFTKS